jgi:hypothetical protein
MIRRAGVPKILWPAADQGRRSSAQLIHHARLCTTLTWYRSGRKMSFLMDFFGVFLAVLGWSQAWCSPGRGSIAGALPQRAWLMLPLTGDRRDSKASCCDTRTKSQRVRRQADLSLPVERSPRCSLARSRCSLADPADQEVGSTWPCHAPPGPPPQRVRPPLIGWAWSCGPTLPQGKLGSRRRWRLHFAEIHEVGQFLKSRNGL